MMEMSVRKTIVGLGEVLWDVFPDGPRFGGAPANFACSASAIGGREFEIAMVSAVGTDDLGQKALQEFRNRQVDVSCLSSLDRPTGQVLVTLDSSGQASYRFLNDTAWDHLGWSVQLQNLATRADAVCFGTLGQRSEVSRSTIRQFLAATPAHCLRVLDINLRAPYWDSLVISESLPLASVLKLNSDELPIVARLLSMDGTEVELLKSIRQKFSLRLVALTRGANGSMLLNDAGELSEIQGQPISIVDTVGAGDAFTAAITIGLLSGKSLRETHVWADQVAAFVCSQQGATPEFPPGFKLHI
jgi:fructokinase